MQKTFVRRSDDVLQRHQRMDESYKYLVILRQKELFIPCFIKDYNQYIRAIDLANQFRHTRLTRLLKGTGGLSFTGLLM